MHVLGKRVTHGTHGQGVLWRSALSCSIIWGVSMDVLIFFPPLWKLDTAGGRVQERGGRSVAAEITLSCETHKHGRSMKTLHFTRGNIQAVQKQEPVDDIYNRIHLFPHYMFLHRKRGSTFKQTWCVQPFYLSFYVMVSVKKDRREITGAWGSAWSRDEPAIHGPHSNNHSAVRLAKLRACVSLTHRCGSSEIAFPQLSGGRTVSNG